MPRIDEAFVMSQKVVGLKRLCDKYKLSKKGRKAELQKIILMHLKLGDWSEATEETSVETTKDGGTNNNQIAETPSEESLSTKAAISGESVSNTKLEQWNNTENSNDALTLDQPKGEGNMEKKPEEENVLVIQLDQTARTDDTEMNVSEEEDVNPFAGMQPLPLFPRDDNIESRQKRTAEVAGISGDQAPSKKQRLETGDAKPASTSPCFPPFYKDEWVPVGGKSLSPAKADLKVIPSTSEADLLKPSLSEIKPSLTETKPLDVSTSKDAPDEVKTLWDLGQTKAQIEEFLNRHDHKELVELCVDLCAVDPDLLYELSKENGKATGDNQLSHRKILIYGLNTELTAARDLELAFSKHGNVAESFVARDATGKSKGYGFVTMSTIAEAGAALENAPRLLDGWPTRCTLATIRKKFIR